jgi:hypothetical protein
VIQFSISKALLSKIRSATKTQFYFNKPQRFLVNLLQFENFQGCLVPSLVFKVPLPQRNAFKKTLNSPLPHVTNIGGSSADFSSPFISFCGDHCISPCRAGVWRRDVYQLKKRLTLFLEWGQLAT